MSKETIQMSLSACPDLSVRRSNEYFVSAAPLTDLVHVETLQMFISWSEYVHVVLT